MKDRKKGLRGHAGNEIIETSLEREREMRNFDRTTHSTYVYVRTPTTCTSSTLSRVSQIPRVPQCLGIETLIETRGKLSRTSRAS